MTDSDDKVARRYRELAREEPRGAIDAAILAASRRAVAPRSWSRRWAAPVSIAAVLVLAFGLTLEMQHEKPDVASPASEVERPAIEPPAPPAKESAPSPLARDAAPQARPDAFAVTPPAKPEAPERRAAKSASASPDRAVAAPGRTVTEPSALAKEAPAVREDRLAAPAAREDKLAAPVVNDETRREAPVEIAAPFPAQRANIAPAAPAAAGAAPARRAASSATAPVAVSPPPAAQPGMQSKERMAAPRFKAESADALSPAAPSAGIERELERIAKLRAEGRDADADKALDEFRRAHPDYRIAEAMWDRVRRR
ncbi:MAG: hypothetical protein ACXWAU_16345 [Usitatibacter sp.]